MDCPKLPDADVWTPDVKVRFPSGSIWAAPRAPE